MSIKTAWFKNLLVVFSLVFAVGVFANSQQGATTQYGPIKRGDTLWQIARAIQLPNMTRLQTMRYLHKHNPGSFVRGDINRLKQGSYLRLPNTNPAPAQEEVLVVEVPINQSNITIPAVNTKAAENAKKLQAEVAAQLARTAPQTTSVLGPFMPANSTQDIIKLQNDLNRVTQELNLTRNTLKGLQSENVRLNQLNTNQTTQFNQSMQQARAEFNKNLQDAQAQLAKSHNQQQALQVKLSQANEQRSLLKTEYNSVLATVKALNSDISTLEERVVELEALQKMKDAHIVELKKALTHSSSVIKEQTAVNMQLNQRMNELEAKFADAAGMSQNKLSTLDQTQATILAPQEAVINVMPVPNTEQNTIKTAATNRLTPIVREPREEASQLSLLLEDENSVLSTKFWFIIVLAIFLFILAFFWRSLSGHNDHF